MAIGLGAFINIARSVDRLLALEQRHGELIASIQKELRELADRVTKLEAREVLLIAEAKAAAATAASIASSGHLADLARQVGALEERTRRSDVLAITSGGTAG